MVKTINGRDLSKRRAPLGPLGKVPFTNQLVTLKQIIHCGNCGAPLPEIEVGRRYLSTDTHSFIFRENPLPMAQCESCDQRGMGAIRMVHIRGENRFVNYSTAIRLGLGFEAEWWIAVSKIETATSYTTGLKPQVNVETDLEMLMQLFEDGALPEEELVSLGAKKARDPRLQQCHEDGVISTETLQAIIKRYDEMMDIR